MENLHSLCLDMCPTDSSQKKRKVRIFNTSVSDS